MFNGDPLHADTFASSLDFLGCFYLDALSYSALSFSAYSLIYYCFRCFFCSGVISSSSELEPNSSSEGAFLILAVLGRSWRIGLISSWRPSGAADVGRSIAAV